MTREPDENTIREPGPSGTQKRVGEEGLGEFAREQIEKARNDPRLGRGRGAMVADFWDAIEEAERTRMLGVLGLHELTGVLERYEQEHGVSRDDDDLDPNTRNALQARWERAESASIEIANGFPHLNAQALVSMNSALDAQVEEYVPAMRAIAVSVEAERLMKAAEGAEPEAAAQITPEMGEKLSDALVHVLEGQLPNIKRLTGSGVERYEAPLRQVGLAAPDDRPLPADLDQALAELGALRDVVTHRSGRVDQKALEQAPSLRYAAGDLVRITADEYRTYSAAIRCYASEITFRSIRAWPNVTDSDGPNLAGWRADHMLGV